MKLRITIVCLLILFGVQAANVERLVPEDEEIRNVPEEQLEPNIISPKQEPILLPQEEKSNSSIRSKKVMKVGFFNKRRAKKRYQYSYKRKKRERDDGIIISILKLILWLALAILCFYQLYIYLITTPFWVIMLEILVAILAIIAIYFLFKMLLGSFGIKV